MTGKNKYQINALMKKVSYGNIWTKDIKQQQQNAMHSFFNMQLKSGRGRGFTCMTFGKCPHYIEHVPE